MRPKNHKQFKKGIAEKVGVHQDVVDDFITFYFAKVRKNLSDLTYASINVYGMGTFHIRKQVLLKTIKKNKSILGNLEKNTYKGYEKHIGVINKLALFEKTQNMLEVIDQEKKDFREKQK